MSKAVVVGFMKVERKQFAKHGNIKFAKSNKPLENKIKGLEKVKV